MSGDSVIANAGKMEDFARKLDRFKQTLSENIRLLEAGYKELGETWRDPEYQKFANEFTQTMKSLRSFEREASAVVPSLRAKARRIREVHHR